MRRERVRACVRVEQLGRWNGSKAPVHPCHDRVCDPAKQEVNLRIFPIINKKFNKSSVFPRFVFTVSDCFSLQNILRNMHFSANKKIENEKTTEAF